MKTRNEIKGIQARVAPIAEFGSFYAGWRAAEHRLFETRFVIIAAACGLLMGVLIGGCAF